jgi:hypothetical protein
MVRHIFSSQLDPKRHIDEALETLEKIQEAERGNGQQHPTTGQRERINKVDSLLLEQIAEEW